MCWRTPQGRGWDWPGTDRGALKSFKERVGRDSRSWYWKQTSTCTQGTYSLTKELSTVTRCQGGSFCLCILKENWAHFENFWISNFSFAMVECYEKATYRRTSLFWTYGSRCSGSIMAGTAGDRNDSWTTAENSYLQLVTGSKENALEVAHGFWNLKAYPQWQTFSSQVTFPKFTQIEPPSGEQVFRCPRMWGTSHSNFCKIYHSSSAKEIVYRWWLS